MTTKASTNKTKKYINNVKDVVSRYNLKKKLDTVDCKK